MVDDYSLRTVPSLTTSVVLAKSTPFMAASKCDPPSLRWSPVMFRKFRSDLEKQPCEVDWRRERLVWRVFARSGPSS